MYRSLLIFLLFGLFAVTAWSQEESDTEPDENVQPETATVQPEAEADADAEDAEQDEIVIDDEYYQDVDDKDFRPSEDVPADQSISFPTDI